MPPGVAAGIRLHRRIDSWTDVHPVWCQSRERFPSVLRRFAGVAVDMVYDHFLARDFTLWHATPLSEFTRAAYDDIRPFEAHFTPNLARIFPHMVEMDWLASYAELPNVERALERMSTRSPRTAPLADTGAALAGLYTELEADFGEFFPQLREYAGSDRSDLLDVNS